MQSDSGPVSEDTAAFRRALAGMKRRGSNVLVVGGGETDAHVEACTRLLGQAHTRYRLFVFTDGVTRLDDRLSRGSQERSAVRVIDCGSGVRSAAAGGRAPTRGSGGGPGSRIEIGSLKDLGALGDAVDRAIGRFEAENGAFDAAELRVCVDSVEPLLAEHTDREVFRFLHAVTDEVRRERGIGHFHLPVPRENQTVRLLEPLFDAVVEVRGDPTLEQRWHLKDRNLSTVWLPL